MTGPLLVNSDYVPLVNLIGIIFQIRDDYVNLQDVQVSLNTTQSASSGNPDQPLTLLSTPPIRATVKTSRKENFPSLSFIQYEPIPAITKSSVSDICYITT